MSEVKLKTCPFCGGEATIYKDIYEKYLVSCNECGTLIGAELEDGVELIDGWHATFDSKSAATEAWNRRVDNG